jgi:AraC family transcriptional regulator
MNYLEQIMRAIDYIEQNLEDELIIDKISKEAGISKWHFQRVFKCVVGETVKDYTLIRRLSLAAQDLIKTDESILQIATRFQFESHEVFLRAFKRVFQQTPSEFRKLNNQQSSIPQKPRITIQYLEHLFQGVQMEPKIIQLPTMYFVGVKGIIKSVLNPDFTKNFETVPQLWELLKQELKTINLTNPAERVSLIQALDESKMDSDLEYFAGVIVTEDFKITNQNLEKRILPPANYAEFLHRGSVRNVNHTMRYIYGSWFPRSGKLRAVGPEVSFYSWETDPHSDQNEVRILTPIK